MKIVLKILAWVGGIALALVLLVVASVGVDALVGRDRVDVLVNTSAPAVAVDAPDVGFYVARPDEPGTYPAVIMIHEFWGLRSSILGKADLLAAEGYVVVAPDTMRGNSTNWLPRAIFQTITTPQENVNQDLDAVFAWLADQPDVDPDRIMVMGFCYGGTKSLAYSLHNDQLAATATFYGGGPIADPAQLSQLPGPVLGVFGAEDTSIPLAEVDAFEMGLAAAQIPHEVTIYDGVGHAFVTDAEAIQAGGAPGEAWAQLLQFLRDNL
jgi:carboxymethylenebutenolidase